MIVRARAAALLLFTLTPSLASAQPDLCDYADCDDHGTCFIEQRRALCLCDPGYAAIGTSCVETDEVDVFRLRRAPRAGERAAELAASQVGRRRSTIQDERIGGAEPLAAYLDPEEWWCGDFVSWVYAAAGIPFTQGEAGGWLITNNLAIAAWYEQHNLWVDRDSRDMDHYTPRPGDYVRIRTPSGGGHAGIVHHVEGDAIEVIEGNVSGEVMSSLYYHFRRARRILGFGITTLPNEAPRVEAPTSITAVVGRPIVIEAEASDTGPEELIRFSWSKTEGPDSLRLGVRDAPELSATFSDPARYTLRVTVTDGELSSSCDVEVNVVANAPPVVTARAEPGRLLGTLEDDGVPRSSSVMWTQVAGPETATIEAPDQLVTPLELPSGGAYVFRLTADDTDERGFAEVTVEAPSLLGACRAAPGAPPPLAWLALCGLALLCRLGQRKIDRPSGQPT